MHKELKKPKEKIAGSHKSGRPCGKRAVDYSIRGIVDRLNEYEVKTELGEFETRHLKWTPVRFGEHCGVSKITIVRIQQGLIKHCSYETLEKISNGANRLLHVHGCTPYLLVKYNLNKTKKEEVKNDDRPADCED